MSIALRPFGLHHAVEWAHAESSGNLFDDKALVSLLHEDKIDKPCIVTLDMINAKAGKGWWAMPLYIQIQALELTIKGVPLAGKMIFLGDFVSSVKVKHLHYGLALANLWASVPESEYIPRDSSVDLAIHCKRSDLQESLYFAFGKMLAEAPLEEIEKAQPAIKQLRATLAKSWRELDLEASQEVHVVDMRDW